MSKTIGILGLIISIILILFSMFVPYYCNPEVGCPLITLPRILFGIGVVGVIISLFYLFKKAKKKQAKP